MDRAHIIVSGLVQGVSFRWFVRDKAQDLGLVGTVMNLYNGNVEVFAEGQKNKIEALVKAMKKGNGYSRVDKTHIDWTAAQDDCQDFRIVF